jgi:hypothetical protein
VWTADYTDSGKITVKKRTWDRLMSGGERPAAQALDTGVGTATKRCVFLEFLAVSSCTMWTGLHDQEIG